MTRAIEKTLYQFDELADRAKETARQWWRDLEAQDWDSECVIADAVECARILGIEIDGTPNKPRVYWSGFWSQGDGASFTGRYAYVKGAAKAIREHAPQDTELHKIADALQEAQRRNFYRLEARSTCDGFRYLHSGTMSVDVEDSNDSYRDIGNAEDDVRDALRSFADWIYRQLEKEYEYTMSDENVDESIRINEYEFDETGAIA
jgi:hypothetical protein